MTKHDSRADSAQATGTRERQASDVDDAAEAATLGAVFVDAAYLDDLAAILTPDDFGCPWHRHVFAAMLACREDGEPVDVLTVGRRLHQAGLLAATGSLPALSCLMDGIPRLINAPWYALDVRRASLARATADAARRLAEAAERGDDIAEAWDQAIAEGMGQAAAWRDAETHRERLRAAARGDRELAGAALAATEA